MRFMGTPSGGVCSFDGCGRVVNDKARLSGLCKQHYHQRRKRRAAGLLPLLMPIGHATAPRALLPNPDLPGTMLVPLTKGAFAIVDASVADVVGTRRWGLSTCRRLSYAKAGDGTPLHRFLWRHWGLPDTPEVDHQNGNGLDCRRENLRAATRAQNARNTGPKSDNVSGFKGVHWDSRTRRWGASITANGKTHWLGRFNDPAEAGKAYEQAARELHGEFARVA